MNSREEPQRFTVFFAFADGKGMNRRRGFSFSCALPDAD